MVTMKCRICGAKVTFNSKTSMDRKVSSKNAQQLEDKRAEMLAEWKKSKRLSTEGLDLKARRV